jgi:hypothetical protein
MLSEPFVYEAKYGWNRQAAKVIGICLTFCVVVLVVTTPLWLRIVTVGFFGVGGLLILTLCFTRKTALRIDASGMTMSKSPLNPRSTRFYPWEDVEKIFIWQYNQLKIVGVQRREGAVPLGHRPIGKTSQAALAITAPGVPLEVAATGVVANAWVLDRQRLSGAVAHFAPQVHVLDTTIGRLLHPPPNPESPS